MFLPVFVGQVGEHFRAKAFWVSPLVFGDRHATVNDLNIYAV